MQRSDEESQREIGRIKKIFFPPGKSIPTKELLTVLQRFRQYLMSVGLFEEYQRLNWNRPGPTVPFVIERDDE